MTGKQIGPCTEECLEYMDEVYTRPEAALMDAVETCLGGACDDALKLPSPLNMLEGKILDRGRDLARVAHGQGVIDGFYLAAMLRAKQELSDCGISLSPSPVVQVTMKILTEAMAAARTAQELKSEDGPDEQSSGSETAGAA